jgi:hypothetical protein
MPLPPMPLLPMPLLPAGLAAHRQQDDQAGGSLLSIERRHRA